MHTAMTRPQKSAYGSSQVFVVQTNRLSANPMPLATISQPNDGRKIPVVRTAQPQNAAKVPRLTQALANPMFHVESKVSQTRVDVGAAVARVLQARVCEEISREQCPEHERHGGTPGRIALGAAEQQAEADHEPCQRDESKHGHGVCDVDPGGLGRIAEEGRYLLTCCVELGSPKVVIAMIGTKVRQCRPDLCHLC